MGETSSVTVNIVREQILLHSDAAVKLGLRHLYLRPVFTWVWTEIINYKTCMLDDNVS